MLNLASIDGKWSSGNSPDTYSCLLSVIDQLSPVLWLVDSESNGFPLHDARHHNLFTINCTPFIGNFCKLIKGHPSTDSWSIPESKRIFYLYFCLFFIVCVAGFSYRNSFQDLHRNRLKISISNRSTDTLWLFLTETYTLRLDKLSKEARLIILLFIYLYVYSPSLC